MPIAVGESLGNYRILRHLGSGGMGLVYLAEQELIGRKVALKVIHKELAQNREIIIRFFNEARAVNQIDSEHVVEIHDLGQGPDGEYFFVMEYIDGHNLAQVLTEEGHLEIGQALHVGAQIADALDAAHRSGIMHRDLKPDNIMLVDKHGDPDFVKVLDFGLAKMFAQAGGGQQLTARGVILGTPQYMAPEACEGKGRVDYRSDIYSLGVLLFQMCTGHVPFDGSTMGEVLIKQVRELPPAPLSLNGDIPPAVEQVILRCLAKQPDSRFQSMVAVRDALLDPDRYLASGPGLMPSAAAAIDSDQARTLIRKRPSMELPLPPSGPSTVRELHEIAGLADQVQHVRATSQSDTIRRTVQPIVPENRTVRLAGQPTVQAQPARRSWLLWLAVTVIPAALGVAGVALFSSGGERPEAGSPATDASPTRPSDQSSGATSGMPADAAPPPVDAPVDTVRMHFVTTPSGAKILDAQGRVLGVTPTTIELPRDGAEHVLTLRHESGAKRTKTVRASGDGRFEITLEK